MEKLPRFRVNKGLHYSQDQMREFTDTANTWTEDREISGKEKEKTEDFKEKMHEFIDGHIQWIQNNLQLDVSERRPSEEKIYLYHPNTLKKYLQGGSASMNPASKEIRIGEPSRFYPLEKSFQDLSHELVHTFSDTRFFLREDPENENEFETETFLFGYSSKKKDKFILLNEAVTEMMSIDILQDLKQTGMDYKKKDYHAYQHERTLLQMIIEKALSQSGKTVTEIKFHLYKGYILGDLSYLRILRTALGSESFRYLSDLKPSNEREMYDQWCENLGLNLEEFKKRDDDDTKNTLYAKKTLVQK